MAAGSPCFMYVCMYGCEGALRCAEARALKSTRSLTGATGQDSVHVSGQHDCYLREPWNSLQTLPLCVCPFSSLRWRVKCCLCEHGELKFDRTLIPKGHAMITVCLLFSGHAHARGNGMHHTCTMRRCWRGSIFMHACVEAILSD